MRLVPTLAAGVTLLGTCACAAEPRFPLVDGPRQAVIVGDDSTRSGGRNVFMAGPPHALQHYIERSTGRRIEVVPEDRYDPATMPFAIFVGRSRKGLELFGERLAAMDRDAYIVHVAPDAVVLIGASEHASAWAQYDFLREYLGVDVYFPARCGLVVPRHERVLIPPGTRVESPAFLSRAFSGLNTPRGLRGQTEIPWRLHTGHGRYAFHHNIHTFIPVAEFGKTHPEYFPMQGGKRLIVSTSAGPGPCISNPDVLRIVIEKCRAFFDKNPDAAAISLGMTDGGWCECPQCRAMDGPSIEVNGARSPRSARYYRFLNPVAEAVARSHPGRSIGVLGYAGAEYPPEGFDVARNIIPYLCFSRANWYNPEARARDLKATEAWISRVDRIGVYEYLYGAPYSVPRLYSGRLAEFLADVAHRAPGSGFYAEIYSNHGLDGPKAWIAEKLLWNPRQDPQALLRRWCRAVFADAAEPMERYFRGLEDTWSRNGLRADPGLGKLALYGDDRQCEIFRPEELAPRLAELDEARRLAPSPEVLERIEYFASTFRITELTVREYHAYREAKRLAAENAPAAALLAALIEGDRARPDEDVKEYIAKVQAEDRTRFEGGVEVRAGAEIARRIVIDLAWPEVRRALKSGERAPERLAAAARAALAGVLPSTALQDPVARRRVDGLLDMASRIVVARRVTTPPVIDGAPDEALWRWNDHFPWYAWKSGLQSGLHTRCAFAWDDDFLYIALRCPQPGLDQLTRCKDYGAPAWKYASVEFFLHPDPPEADLADPVRYTRDPPEKLRQMQVIPAYGGGLWEREQHAVEKWASTDDPAEWRAELKISFRKLGFSPARFPYMRLGMVRNIADGGHSGVSWFPSTGAHAAWDAHGWIVFE